MESGGQIFTARTNLFHFTPALRNPVFINGANYIGTLSILSMPFRRDMTEQWLTEEVTKLRNAFCVPLGKGAKTVLAHFAAQGRLERNRILEGLPHPPGVNAERKGLAAAISACGGKVQKEIVRCNSCDRF